MLGQMALHPRLSRSAVELVKRLEGYRRTAARTPDGGFTLGYGHTLTAREGAQVNEADAEALLLFDLSRVAEAVEGALLAPVTDNQFAALVSFAFNIGTENFKGSSALRRLNEGAYLQAAAAIELWRRAEFDGDALVVDQLVRRRAAEKALFLTPPEGFAPAPSASLRVRFDHSVIGAATAWAAARERTALGRIAMEGEDAGAELAAPAGSEADLAPSAAIAAADALAVRLSRILPEDDAAEDTAPTPSVAAAPPLAAFEPTPAPTPAPLVLEAEESGDEPETELGGDTVETPQALADVSAPTPLRADAPPVLFATGFELPPPPAARAASLAGLTEGDGVSRTIPAHGPTAGEDDGVSQTAPFGGPAGDDGATRPTPLAPDALAAFVAEAPPFVSPAPPEAANSDAPPAADPFGAPRRRLTERFATAFQGAAPADLPPASNAEEPAQTLFDPPRRTDPFAEARAAATIVPDTAAVPLLERPAFFFGLGLLGVALFAGSIFCMLYKASFTCLLIGMVGILAMAPAAAFFLFRFLGKPVDPNHEAHADLLSTMRDGETAADDLPEPSQPSQHSAFDRTDWR